jgi:hypothetical protein
MNLKSNIDFLKQYNLLDCEPDAGLAEFAKLAAVYCDMPIGAVYFTEGEQLYVKGAVGVDYTISPFKGSFFEQLLTREALMVKNAEDDLRFYKNPNVKGNEHVRFYTGVPIKVNGGLIIGALSVVDTKPNSLTNDEVNGLKQMAKDIATYLTEAKEVLPATPIESGLARNELQKLADGLPGVIYSFTMNEAGQTHFGFISKGISELHSDLSVEGIVENPQLAFSIIHPDDLPVIQQGIGYSYQTLKEWYAEYRVVTDNGYAWHSGRAMPHKNEDGSVTWYGMFNDISDRIEYENKLRGVVKRTTKLLEPLLNAIKDEQSENKQLLAELEQLKAELSETELERKKYATGHR